MSFSIPNTFVAGTKAKADEVNENFVSVQNEINKESENIANLTEELNYVKNELVGEFVAESEMLAKNVKSRFCVNFANLDETGTKTDLFDCTGSTVSFKVGGDYPLLIGTNAFGDSETFDSIESVDFSNKLDGSYNVFLTLEGSIELFATKIFRTPKMPAGVVINDIWLMTAEPWNCYKFNGISWVDFESIPLGQITVSNGLVTSVQNNVLNTQYLDSDCFFLTETARRNLSKRFETDWFTPTSGQSYTFEHNLNIDPLHSRARILARVKSTSGSFNQDDIVETLYSNYAGSLGVEVGYVLKYTLNTLTLGVGNSDTHCFNAFGGAGDLKKSNVDIKIILTQDIN